MYLHRAKLTFLVLLTGICGMSHLALAQTISKSPYSRIGIGDLQLRGLAQNYALAGSGQALTSVKNINISNPASLSNITQTTFEAGVNADFYRISTTDASEKHKSLNPAYLSLAFPITKKWVAALGLTPYSSVGYNLTSTEMTSNYGHVNYIYQGNGGINRFFFSNGVKIYKGLSVGVNASYLFGTINRIRKIEPLDSTSSYNTKVDDNLTTHDFYFDYGLQYQLPLKKDYILTLGLTYTSACNLNTSKSHIATSYTSVAGYETVKDSSTTSTSGEGVIKLPSQWAMGVSLRNSKWLATAEYNIQYWSRYQEFDEVGLMADSKMLRLGGYYTPNVDAVNQYMKIVQYRMGFRMGSTNLMVNGEHLNEIAFSVGVGLPIRRTQNMLNISSEIGKRGTTNNHLIEEQFIRLNIGLTFNDKWFIKRKYD